MPTSLKTTGVNVDNAAIKAEVIRRAQTIAQEKGLIPGEHVAHPSDPIVYELISIDGNTAIIGLKAKDSPTGQEIRKSFPLKELFNLDTARGLITSVVAEEFRKTALFEMQNHG